ncbi:MAG: SDR family oxidoreductase [Deltaproteobacteria bacterium]|nr:SDR family oxidoreductase [Deltaproteobacteria bacterium]
MDLGLKGKVAIVTGSSDGIGLVTAQTLLREGAKVVICARRDAKLIEARDWLVKETGGEVLAVQCDVRRLEDVQRLVKETLQRLGAIHILINNAGSVPAIKFADVSDQQWYENLERKLMGYLRMAREVVPHMQTNRWGRIVNVAGTAGLEPSNTAMAVGLNNAAVINWTKSMSLEYAADGILVNTVAPGSIDTPRQTGNRQREAEVTGKSVEEIRQARAKEIPLHRLGVPQEVANVIVFMASECSSYMSGTCVTVDGGVVRGI